MNVIIIFISIVLICLCTFIMILGIIDIIKIRAMTFRIDLETLLFMVLSPLFGIIIIVLLLVRNFYV